MTMIYKIVGHKLMEVGVCLHACIHDMHACVVMSCIGCKPDVFVYGVLRMSLEVSIHAVRTRRGACVCDELVPRKY